MRVDTHTLAEGAGSSDGGLGGILELPTDEPDQVHWIRQERWSWM